MYSRVLRTINSTNVNQSTIVYRRKVKLDWSAKRILFLLIDIYLSVYVCVRTNEYCKMNLTICNLMREKEGFEQLLLPFAINDLVNSKLGQNISNNMICNLFNCLQNFLLWTEAFILQICKPHCLVSSSDQKFMWNIKVKLFYQNYTEYIFSNKSLHNNTFAARYDVELISI